MDFKIHEASLWTLLANEEKKHHIYRNNFANSDLEYICIRDLTARQISSLFTVVTLRRYEGKNLNGSYTLVGMVFEELTDRCVEMDIHLID